MGKFSEFSFGDFSVGPLVDLVDFLGQDLLGVIFGRTCFEPLPFLVDGDDGVIIFTFLLDAPFQVGPRLFSGVISRPLIYK